MSNALKPERQKHALHMFLEGNSIRSTERVTKIHWDTICRLLVGFGNRCKHFMDNRLRALTLDHIEVDEVWTFVAKKQGRLTPQKNANGMILGTYTFELAWIRKPSWWQPIHSRQAVG